MALTTRANTSNWSFGKELLTTLSKLDSRLLPDLVGNLERCKELFVSIEACEHVWAPFAQIRSQGSMSELPLDFFWRNRRAPKVRGYVTHTILNQFGRLVPGAVNLSSNWEQAIDWLELFREISMLSAPQLGMLHLFSAVELSRSDLNCSFSMGSFGPALAPEVAELGWAMYFGDEFAKEVDETLVSNAGFPIERFANGYLIKVTDDISDVSRDFSAFSARRETLKSLFRQSLFTKTE